MRLNAKAVLLLVLLTPVLAMAATPGHAQRKTGGGQGLICADCEEPPPPGGGGTGGGGTTTPTPAMVANHRIDPIAKTLQISFTNGLSVEINDATGRVVVTQGTARSETTVDAAFLQLAKGNVTLANSYKAEMRAMFADPTNVLQFSKQNTSSLTSGTTSLRAGKRGGTNTLMMDGSYQSFACQYGGNCHYQPQYIDWGGGSGGNYGFGYVAAGGVAPGSDYFYWQQFRDAACDAAQDNFEDAGLATGALALSCGLAETGVGLIGCGISGIAVLVYMDRAADNSRTCSAPYPGPGRW